MNDFLEYEDVIDDDQKVIGDYFYLADGKIYKNQHHGITVGELKNLLGAKEIRRCSWRRWPIM